MGLASGTKLGPYEIQSALGARGLGEVYRARDTRRDRTVAIKILSAHLSAQFRTESPFRTRSPRHLFPQPSSHLSPYDIGSQDGAAFLVREYLEGETLADRLHKSPLPLKQVLDVAVQITEALATAHHAGILHRDLKPGNVMLPRRRRQVAGFFRVVASFQGGAGTARSCSSSIPPTT